jgi:hypothetical protein
VTTRRLIITALVVLGGFVLSWSLLLVGDPCGAEDGVECTPLGWVLLWVWMALGLILAVLLLVLAWRAARAVVKR